MNKTQPKRSKRDTNDDNDEEGDDLESLTEGVTENFGSHQEVSLLSYRIDSVVLPIFSNLLCKKLTITKPLLP